MTGQSLRCASCESFFHNAETRCTYCQAVRPPEPPSLLSSALVPTVLTAIVMMLFVAWVITYGSSLR